MSGEQSSEMIPRGMGLFGLMRRDRQLYDAAKRVSDTWNLAGTNLFGSLLQGAQHWLAFRISDGGSDEVAYDTRAEAIAHQLHETQCMYLQLTVDTMPTIDAAHLIVAHRRIYDNGGRLIDPLRLGPI